MRKISSKEFRICWQVPLVESRSTVDLTGQGTFMHNACMENKSIEARISQIVSSISEGSGVDEGAVAKVLEEIGLSKSLKKRLETDTFESLEIAQIKLSSSDA